jgi:hypothetical protein
METIYAVAAENAGALVELRLAVAPLARLSNAVHLEQVLRAAPLLRVLDANLACSVAAEACRLLRNEAPFGPLRAHCLFMAGLADAAAVRSVAEGALSHAWLTGLFAMLAPLNEPATLDAVVDMALHRRLTLLILHQCGLSPASAPALARLVAGGSLETLLVHGEPSHLLDEPAAVLLGNALRANTSLTSVTFKFVGLFADAAAVTALLGALTAHPTVQKLDLSYNFNDAEEPTPAALAAAVAALGALVAANAPALRELRLDGCDLTDAGLGPLVDALPANTHLRVLDCRHNFLSEPFKHERLLPAVRANAWLEAMIEESEEEDE